MSQKKVEQYKEFKKNREKIYAKQKRTQKLQVILAAVLAVLVIGWFGYSIYNSATRPAVTEDGAVQPVEMDFADYTEYLDSLQQGYQ
ncbi:MAG: hypothetical protein E7240_11690 [Lachnospiraceae bacterium]|nr:hypothetical protein [Lachnospiraceae bacterium]